MEKTSILKKEWFAILMVVFLAPFGIFLIWKNKLFPVYARILLSVIFGFIFFIFFIGVTSNRGSSNPTNTTQQASSQQISQTPLTADEIQQMYSNPDTFKGRQVELSGKVFGTVDKNSDSVAFQMWQDPLNSEGNTAVIFNDPSIKLAADDFVIVKGVVNGKAEGQNAFSGNVVAPKIVASSVVVSDFQTAIAPATKTVEVNQTIDQGGYSITLKKVEFSELDTRFYLTASNNSSDKVSIYTYSAKVVQNGKQIEADSYNSYSTNYPELSTDILQGVTTEGILAFPKMEVTNSQLNIEGYSSDYTNRLSPFVFDVNIQVETPIV